MPVVGSISFAFSFSSCDLAGREVVVGTTKVIGSFRGVIRKNETRSAFPPPTLRKVSARMDDSTRQSGNAVGTTVAAVDPPPAVDQDAEIEPEDEGFGVRHFSKLLIHLTPQSYLVRCC